MKSIILYYCDIVLIILFTYLATERFNYNSHSLLPKISNNKEKLKRKISHQVSPARISKDTRTFDTVSERTDKFTLKLIKISHRKKTRSMQRKNSKYSKGDQDFDERKAIYKPHFGDKKI